MRDGDPHKSVTIHEMFERITVALELIAQQFNHPRMDGHYSTELRQLHQRVEELRDIMSKADD
jgi:hypothetical protein